MTTYEWIWVSWVTASYGDEFIEDLHAIKYQNDTSLSKNNSKQIDRFSSYNNNPHTLFFKEKQVIKSNAKTIPLCIYIAACMRTF